MSSWSLPCQCPAVLIDLNWLDAMPVAEPAYEALSQASATALVPATRPVPARLPLKVELPSPNSTACRKRVGASALVPW